MSAGLHEATDTELTGIWPAARAARLFPNAHAFRAWRDSAPWRVQFDDRGDAALLVPWRSHLDLLALKALWCPAWRVPVLLDQLRDLARLKGFSRLVSPLLAEDAVEPYLQAGMDVRERLITLRAAPQTIARVELPQGVGLRRATVGDVAGIAAVEAACFDDFWLHEASEIYGELAVGRLVVAYEGASVLGYTLSGVSRNMVTLGRLAVAPAAQRRGIGRALLADVAEYAGECGAAEVTLCTQRTNEGSRALYAACGFRELPDGLVIAMDRSSAIGRRKQKP